jgi:glutamate-1-semialdehyde 2,1-aminomutase
VTSTRLEPPSAIVESNERSRALLARAAAVTPGGVNTARRKIDPPLCGERASGAYIEDLDGNRYIDFHAAYGAILLGHCYPAVNERVRRVMDRQDLFGVGTTELEVAVAEKIVEHVPSAEQAVICGSGSEATFHAIRLARAATGRQLIVKFQGHYHGFHDYVLRNVISAPEQIGKRDPASAGMLEAAIDATLVCRYNDLQSVRDTFSEHGADIAAIILEPIAHNSPSILPEEGFLPGLRAICDEHESLMIFDEVITGFRHALGGYQSICGVMPDLSTFAKAIANGYPMAAVAGRRALLEQFNTTATGNVTFAGTYNGGALAMAAALATIEVLETEPVHEHIFRLGERMRSGLRAIAAELDVPTVVSGYGSLYAMLFMAGPLTSYDDVPRNDAELFLAYRKELVRRGVFEMPENIGRNHIMYSHTDADIDRALEISAEALKAVRSIRRSR